MDSYHDLILSSRIFCQKPSSINCIKLLYNGVWCFDDVWLEWYFLWWVDISSSKVQRTLGVCDLMKTEFDQMNLFCSWLPQSEWRISHGQEGDLILRAVWMFVATKVRCLKIFLSVSFIKRIACLQKLNFKQWFLHWKYIVQLDGQSYFQTNKRKEEF